MRDGIHPMILDDTATSTLAIGDELLWEPVRLASPNPWVGHIRSPTG